MEETWKKLETIDDMRREISILDGFLSNSIVYDENGHGVKSYFLFFKKETNIRYTLKGLRKLVWSRPQKEEIEFPVETRNIVIRAITENRNKLRKELDLIMEGVGNK